MLTNKKAIEISLTVDTTINLNNTMTASAIQALIDAQPKNLSGYSLTFQFADGTYTLSSAIYFNGFFNGFLFIQGNVTENSGVLHSNQAVIINSSHSNETQIDLSNNTASVVMTNIKIAATSIIESVVRSRNSANVKIAGCYISGNPGTSTPDDANTIMLIRFNNNVNNDASGGAIIPVNSGVTFTNVNHKYGSHSGVFNTGNWVYMPYNADLHAIGHVGHTIEFWVKNPVNGTIFSTHDATSYANGWHIILSSTSIAFEGSINLGSVSGLTLNDGNWHHIACVKNGADHYIYVDGIKMSTVNTTFTVASSGLVSRIGRIYTTVNPTISNWVGEIDEFRQSKVARYTAASFTPPQGEFGSGVGIASNLLIDASRAMLEYNYVSNGLHAIRSSLSKVVSMSNDTIVPLAYYGLSAVYDGTISKVGTQPAGSIANEIVDSGGIVRL